VPSGAQRKPCQEHAIGLGSWLSLGGMVMKSSNVSKVVSMPSLLRTRTQRGSALTAGSWGLASIVFACSGCGAQDAQNPRIDAVAIAHREILMTDELELAEVVEIARSRAIGQGFVAGEAVIDDRWWSPDFRSVASMVDGALRFTVTKGDKSGTLAIWSMFHEPKTMMDVVIHISEWLDKREDFNRFYLRGWHVAFLEAASGWTSMEETHAFLESLMQH